MKKMLAVALAVMMLTLGACSNAPASTEAKEESNTAAAQSTEEQETEEKKPEESVTTETKKDGGVFVVPISADINNFNPVITESKSVEMVMRAMYAPLFVIDNNETRYYMAESYNVSEDGLTITVKLKDNMFWHDGEPINADDLVFDFDFMWNEKLKSATGINGEKINCEKVDDLTVKLTLPQPSASYLSTLGNFKMFPEHRYNNGEPFRTTLENEKGIGSGPYKLVSWTKGSTIELERFDEYYRGKPNFDKVIFQVAPEATTQEVAFQKGELGMIEVSDSLKYEKYKADENCNVYSFPDNRVSYFTFNANSEKMQDIELRKAFTYALDRAALYQAAAGDENLAVEHASVYGPQTEGFDENFTSYPHDEAKAKELFEKLGATNQTYKLICDKSHLYLEDIAVAVQSQLAKYGIKVEVTAMDSQGFNNTFFYTTEGDWDLAVNVYPAKTDPNSIAFMYKKGGFLTKNLFASDEALALFNEGDATLDKEKRMEIYKKLQDQIINDYCVYPVLTSRACIVTPKNIRGVDDIKKIPLFEDYMKIFMVE